MHKSAASVYYLFSMPLKGDIGSSGKGPALEQVYCNMLAEQRNHIEGLEEVFFKKITVGSRNNFEKDGKSLKGLAQTLRTDFKKRKESEAEYFQSVLALPQIGNVVKKLDKLILNLLSILEKLNTKNYSPSSIWNKLIEISAAYKKIEEFLSRIIKRLNK